MKKNLLTITLGLFTGLNAIAQVTNTAAITGTSSSQPPYLLPTVSNATTTSIFTATQSVGGYTLAGLPDGTGAIDNGDGTFSYFIAHEMSPGQGTVHAHGQNGAFISKWTINKSTLAVTAGTDVIQNANIWNGSGYTTYNMGTPSVAAQFNRFCSGDVPEVSAFYHAGSGLGTQARFFMNGEESGNEGRAMGTILTGTNAGNLYELPRLGKMSIENSVASPFTSIKTVVALTDDATGGQIYIYVGTKTNTGSDIDKAGLTNGNLYGVAVTGFLSETNAAPPAPTTFSLINFGDVSAMTGASLQTASTNSGVTGFLRPEDGAWDPSNPNDFYFVTTNSFGVGQNTRLWRLRFASVLNPANGGTITAVLTGTEAGGAPQMYDNFCIDKNGHVILQEDVGGQSHLGKMWDYNIATGSLTAIAAHDPTRFLTGGINYLGTQDEEASGVIDASALLGTGMYLFVDQVHNSIPSPVVQGGQILSMFNPLAAPEINLQGNSNNITDGSIATATTNNTHYGSVIVGQNLNQTFVIQNTGYVKLAISSVSITGANASDFAIVAMPGIPFNIGAGSSQPFTIKFTPGAAGTRTALVTINNDDVTELSYDFVIAGTGSVISTGISTSNIATLSFVRLYPNPTMDEAELLFNLVKNEMVTINVFDVTGKKVLSTIEKELAAGEQKVKLNTSSLSNGEYFVKVKASAGGQTIKMVVSH